ncbi:zinc finger protein ZAT3-like [Aristolochia californica]|uniref:zinc finger protein ZAT3-like n=1 Tax=Aristolochia californica TaxID=171875 RepID=UPI0035D9175D
MTPPNSLPSSSKQDTRDTFVADAGDPGSRKRKRSKLNRISSAGGGTDPDSGYCKPRVKNSGVTDSESIKVTRPCSECGKKFSSWKALFGHMRCHPERQWRGIKPPPNFRRPVFGGGVSSYPSDPPPLKFTEEENKVAACLVMMANTATIAPQVWEARIEDQPEAAEPYVCRFECSSCKRVFGSHQALGGHRASHKNVKGCFAIARKDGDGDEENDYLDAGDSSVYSPAVVTDCSERGGEGRMKDSEDERPGTCSGHHKCSICLKIFLTGQALGGHKRCHWEKGGEPGGSFSSLTRGCVVDLNLPPPLENEGTSSALALDLRL